MSDRSSLQWQGSLKLGFAERHGKTELDCLQVQAPLKVQRPFYPEGKAICHSAILHTAGGMVGGDRLLYDLHLAPLARALVTTVAASKVYRSNGQRAQQTLRFQVESGAVLEWLPQEMIVFDGADFDSNLRVDLAPGGCWLAWDITRLGRTARGERLSQGQWRSHLEVWQQGSPLWIDRQSLAGGSPLLESAYGLAGYPVMGTFIFLGKSLEVAEIQLLRELWLSKISSTARFGVTHLPEGLICRYCGSSTAEAKRGFISVWRHLRDRIWGISAPLPRLWPA